MVGLGMMPNDNDINRTCLRKTTNSSYLEFTLNPLLLRSRGVDEEGSQSLIRVILRPIS